MSKVLVGYFSKTGSTKEIAERIGANFAKKGLENDVLKLDEVKNIENYSGFVLGAPINGMKYVPEFVKFTDENKETLKGKIKGLFAVAYIYYDGRGLWRYLMNKSMAKMEGKLNPATSVIFAGRIPEKMPAFANFMFGVKSDLPLDLVNHEEIDKWCEGIL
jgi:menaquinone-dependent protoporphyrinogen IX oxidase